MATTAVSYTGVTRLADRVGPIGVRDLHSFVSSFGRGPEYSAQARIFRGELRLDVVYLESEMDAEDGGGDRRRDRRPPAPPPAPRRNDEGRPRRRRRPRRRAARPPPRGGRRPDRRRPRRRVARRRQRHRQRRGPLADRDPREEVADIHTVGELVELVRRALRPKAAGRASRASVSSAWATVFHTRPAPVEVSRSQTTLPSARGAKVSRVSGPPSPPGLRQVDLARRRLPFEALEGGAGVVDGDLHPASPAGVVGAHPELLPGAPRRRRRRPPGTRGRRSRRGRGASGGRRRAGGGRCRRGRASRRAGSRSRGRPGPSQKGGRPSARAGPTNSGRSRRGSRRVPSIRHSGRQVPPPSVETALSQR